MASYLVQYGTPGFVGRFRSHVSEPLDRDRRVVVRTPRGEEIGVVLCEPEERFADQPDDGDLLRPATDADRAECESRAAAVLAASHTDLPLTFVDAEATLDGTVILHALPWDACDATPHLDALAARFGRAVKLLDLSRAPTPHDDHGCGKPGCGSGGCSTGGCGTGGGCSTGSCSKGKVKSADELTAYFADLRQKMEADSARRTPLV